MITEMPNKTASMFKKNVRNCFLLYLMSMEHLVDGMVIKAHPSQVDIGETGTQSVALSSTMDPTHQEKITNGQYLVENFKAYQNNYMPTSVPQIFQDGPAPGLSCMIDGERNCGCGHHFRGTRIVCDALCWWFSYFRWDGFMKLLLQQLQG
ncbi:uncharacterized protein MELLADRAFT_106015 [Melampsora larici-populina 98AG31]|uniref:Uncharacterized protein n=1 Tax=Melampsora larici-populina (strain 98AG31 / pathotype 3-4-7) TaxID=747676 RepID=F4RK36_MELLP|nr:uncharacterized protein MELLADRAFT_106015 [Melampsora larici-populina 98AG31]EGG07253.1 hypothetical protein MELLADRAFT_106015 [Melampsora larici-populina 98AG31]